MGGGAGLGNMEVLAQHLLSMHCDDENSDAAFQLIVLTGKNTQALQALISMIMPLWSPFVRT